MRLFFNAGADWGNPPLPHSALPTAGFAFCSSQKPWNNFCISSQTRFIKKLSRKKQCFLPFGALGFWSVKTFTFQNTRSIPSLIKSKSKHPALAGCFDLDKRELRESNPRMRFWRPPVYHLPKLPLAFLTVRAYIMSSLTLCADCFSCTNYNICSKQFSAPLCGYFCASSSWCACIWYTADGLNLVAACSFALLTQMQNIKSKMQKTRTKFKIILSPRRESDSCLILTIDPFCRWTTRAGIKEAWHRFMNLATF